MVLVVGKEVVGLLHPDTFVVLHALVHGADGTAAHADGPVDGPAGAASS